MGELESDLNSLSLSLIRLASPYFTSFVEEKTHFFPAKTHFFPAKKTQKHTFSPQLESENEKHNFIFF